MTFIKGYKPTVAQEWWRERYINMGNIASMRALAVHMTHLTQTLTGDEIGELTLVQERLNFVLKNWKRSNQLSKRRFMEGRQNAEKESLCR